MSQDWKFGFSQAPTEFGEERSESSDDIFQNYPDTCAIRSQEIVLRDFGVNIPQEELIAEAQANGWYDHGTPEDAIGNLLDAHGVETNRYKNGNIFNLVNELAQGHKVIVGVDADELWGRADEQHNTEEMMGTRTRTPNHAAIVSAIDTSDPDNVTVTVTDPGTGDACKVYSMEEFEAAWEDSNHLMIATQEPAPPSVPGMENFDYVSGHIPEVYGMPFDDFCSNFGHLGNLPVSSEAFTNGIQELHEVPHDLGDESDGGYDWTDEVTFDDPSPNDLPDIPRETLI